MKRTFREIILTFSLCLIATFGFTQSKEIKIEFLGNCGLYLTDGTTNIYTDFPYKSGAHGYMEFDESELDSIRENSIFIFTHKHSDHYSEKNIKKVIKEKGGKKYGSWNIEELENLKKLVPNFSVQVFKTKHKWSSKHYSYLITWHNKKIFLSGDTESAETIGTIKNIDWAFVPYWVLLDAKENDIKIDAKMFGVYHLATVQIPSAKENYDEIENIRPMVEKGEKITIELQTE
ncbi:MBL fold metallo-hydrolase [Bizionia paragorgiae]|uniref:Beta-lactamase superfamily domain-containing protein n=1 Tax=Bizionia paragorgiae TaxID=283786 RepID=A0A1H3VK04_BIZPA|nr:MBL fold metallo-hydrolase [Bizionia paragorgiae]SDZ75115.1 Beta-lactamase superfamily domain-containing protein [Bizionia paragorgiae]